MKKKLKVTDIVEACGGATVVRKRLKISRQAVKCWVSVPPQHCITLEALCDHTRYEMRPDIFGDDPMIKRKAS